MKGFKNLPEFKKELKRKLEKNADRNIKSAMARSVNVVRNKVVSSISSGASGRTYEKYNPRRTHKASSAGSPPATDTGTLVSGISTSLKVERNVLIGQIKAYAPTGSGDNYALFLEFGTTEMLARPFMQPALNQSSGKIFSIFKEEGVIT